MIYEVSESKEVATVNVQEVTNGVYDVTIDGQKLRISAIRGTGTAYSLLCGNEQWEAIADQRRGDKFDVSVGGRLFHLEVTDQREKSLSEVSGGYVDSGPQTVFAEMPGKVAKLEASAGDEVSAGQVVMIIEAMKMENPIVSPIDGIVKELGANEGDTVESRSTLFVVEPLP